MRWLRRFLRRFKMDGPPQTYRFDEETVLSLHELSRDERRSEEELAEDLINYAIHQRRADNTYLAAWRSLTNREQEVAAYICLNYTNQQISVALSISPETVKTHVRNVLRKFGFQRKIDLMRALAHWDFTGWEQSR